MIVEEEDEEEVDEEVTMARTTVLLGNNIMIISSCNIIVSGRCLRCSQTAGVVTAMVLRGVGCVGVGGFLDNKEGDNIQFMS
jgi:hypothetical protein